MVMVVSAKVERETCEGVCPSCGAQTQFTFLGVQEWPERVAAKLKMPARQKMWLCDACDSTLLSQSLDGCD